MQHHITPYLILHISRGRIAIKHVYLNSYAPSPSYTHDSGLNYDAGLRMYHKSGQLLLERNSFDRIDSEAQQLKRRGISIKLLLDHFVALEFVAKTNTQIMQKAQKRALRRVYNNKWFDFVRTAELHKTTNIPALGIHQRHLADRQN